MKFSILSALTLGLTAGVIAEPTVQARGATRVGRDLATITGVLSGISDKVDSLDSAIQSYSGGDVKDVQSASDNLVDSINAGTTKVNGTSSINEIDALGLTSPVNNLKNKISTVIEHLSAKKSKLVAVGKGGQTYNDLVDQHTAAKQLSAAIVSKVPKELNGIAAGLANGISDAIEKGVNEFQDVKDNSSPSKRAFAPGPAPSSTSAPAAGEESSCPPEPETSDTNIPTSSAVWSSAAAPTDTTASLSVTPWPAPSDLSSAWPAASDLSSAWPAASDLSSAIASAPLWKPTSSALFKGSPSASSAGVSGSASATPSSSQPLFTGAAAVNRISAPAGAVALAALVMAF